MHGKIQCFLGTILPTESKTIPAVQYFLNTQFAVNTHRDISRGNLLSKVKQSHSLDQHEILSRGLLS